MRIGRRTGAVVGAAALLTGMTTAVTGGATAADWSGCLEGTDDRQAVFARAAAVSGVPEEVLLGVSFMQSRWDDHGTSPSTSAGYGPMHLTAVPDAAEAVPHRQGKGESTDGDAAAEAVAEETTRPGVAQDRRGFETLAAASAVTGLPESQLRADEVANICGGAALLASYQRELGDQGDRDATGWSRAVARYSGAADEASALRFTDQVFTVIREGRSRVTNDGHRVTLTAHPTAEADRAAVTSMGLAETSSEGVDCPVGLGCESIPAPYEKYGASAGAYGNHDLAEREQDMDIEYILIHNTEASWNTTLDLVTRPNYLAWNYSLRSSDGHIAQHLDPSDVGWHAGNWYVNMHSIGLEHEGFAARGASWFTESMYQTSATLVRHLSEKYDVPLDRGHIIGHDQVPGHVTSRIPAMHWDPGPYWDWEHYFELLGAPLDAPRDRNASDEVVTVLPGYEGNTQTITGCGSTPCVTDRANFVYLRQAPEATAPLVKDPGLRPNGADSTTRVSDIGARAAAGQKLRVADRQGDWVGVWWLGQIGWIHDPADAPVLQATRAKVVVPKGDAEVPVYGRAYPESSAYPAAIPDQGVFPLVYTVKPGQGYVVTDREIQSDYYYAKTFECAYVELDCTQVLGEDRYYQIELGHRFAYVRAADVEVRNFMGTDVSAGAPRG